MRELMFHREDEGTVSFDRPLVVLIADRGLYQLRDLNPRFTPRLFGYRMVSRSPSMQVAVYARPWMLWLLLRSWENIQHGFWRSVDALLRRHIIHLASSEGMYFRWRDLRFGRGRR